MIRRDKDVTGSAAAYIPPNPTIDNMRQAANACRGCELYKGATQAVFSDGPADAALVFIGEVPGPVEDQQGRPFVGPAGGVFNQALAEAGIDRQRIYLTNVVKHFKWKVSLSNRKVVVTPTVREVRACRPWLDAELALIKPQGIVCLGAVAAQALLGPDFRVSRQRGQFLPGPDGAWIMATVHPSVVLRIPDREAQELAYRNLVADLKKVVERVGQKV